MNKNWQDAARKLRESGYTYCPRKNSIIPGIFVRDGEPPTYLLASTVSRKHQVWLPVDATSLPTEFNQEYAGRHAGMSKVAIKVATSRGDLPIRKTGKKAVVISDSDLLKWLEERPRRSWSSDAYRTRPLLERSINRSLRSVLRTAVYLNEINFSMLFSALQRAGLQEPECLMLVDIEKFFEWFQKLDRQEIVDILAIDGA